MAFTAATTYFANKGTLTLTGAAGASPTGQTIAIIKDCEINMSFEHVPLFGWGSIKRQAVARHSQKVTVKVGYCKFAPDATGASPWFAFWALSPGTGVVSAGALDTNSVQYFDITATFIGENGDIMKGVVKNVAFSNFPVKASEGQWMKVDMDGEGSDVYWSNT